MIRDVIDFSDAWNTKTLHPRIKHAVQKFVSFLEKRLGAEMVYELDEFALKQDGLGDLAELTEKMFRTGLIKKIWRAQQPPDEPQFFQWRVACVTRTNHVSGGGSIRSNRQALTAALAEALERTIWYETTDYFEHPITANTDTMRKRYRIIEPESCAGFSDEQRTILPGLTLRPEAMYKWIKADSLVSGKKVYLPAQLVSGAVSFHNGAGGREPLIRPSITTGLATWSSREGTILRGAYEIIERDAYMIMWFNQLSLPRIDLELAAQTDFALAELLQLCKRYRLQPHVMRLITDAPCYAVCATVEDLSGHLPHYSVGINAHRQLGEAIRHAIMEAVRARISVRSLLKQGQISEEKKAGDVRHYDRIGYWATGSRYTKLKFMTTGQFQDIAPEAWDADTETQNLERIIAWRKASGHELASVALSSSKKNPTSWNIEMVVMPDMQPLHQDEMYATIGGLRLRKIPERYGYAHRAKPYIDEPHPFA